MLFPARKRETGFAFSPVPVLRHEYNSIPEGFDYNLIRINEIGDDAEEFKTI